MSQDSDLQHNQLYKIALQAQRKAIQARKRKIKRASSTAKHKHVVADILGHGTPKRKGVSATQRRGKHGEDQAEQYLQDQGLIVLERNIHCRMGEIDLIATDHTSLIFVEVRLRGSQRYGGAAASVNRHKQNRLIRAAQFFLPQLQARYFAGKMPPCRFDVISIDAQHLHWIKHAFNGTAA